MSITIYHNPRCSKSRRTLELLIERGIEPHIIDYLVSPPSVDEISALLDLLGLEPRDLMRKNEAEYQAAGLDAPDLSRDALIAAMHEHPKIMQRPVVVSKGQARIGRPPEDVLSIV